MLPKISKFINPLMSLLPLLSARWRVVTDGERAGRDVTGERMVDAVSNEVGAAAAASPLSESATTTRQYRQQQPPLQKLFLKLVLSI
jgi:hypothetical protein